MSPLGSVSQTSIARFEEVDDDREGSARGLIVIESASSDRFDHPVSWVLVQSVTEGELALNVVPTVLSHPVSLGLGQQGRENWQGISIGNFVNHVVKVVAENQLDLVQAFSTCRVNDHIVAIKACRSHISVPNVVAVLQPVLAINMQIHNLRCRYVVWVHYQNAYPLFLGVLKERQHASQLKVLVNCDLSRPQPRSNTP